MSVVARNKTWFGCFPLCMRSSSFSSPESTALNTRNSSAAPQGEETIQPKEAEQPAHDPPHALPANDKPMTVEEMEEKASQELGGVMKRPACKPKAKMTAKSKPKVAVKPKAKPKAAAVLGCPRC